MAPRANVCQDGLKWRKNQPSASMSLSTAPAWRKLPKALLHEHLDGGLRPQTLLELCRSRGVQVPARDADALAPWMHANANSGSLERYFPPSDHEEAMIIARDGGLGLTCHAGESDSGDRVLEAAGLGATRIGHGIHIVLGETQKQTDEWVEVARGLGLHFEVCPSSNVHTGAVSSLEVHPIRAMIAAGLSGSCSPDNRLMLGAAVSRALQAPAPLAGLSIGGAAEPLPAGGRGWVL